MCVLGNVDAKETMPTLPTMSSISGLMGLEVMIPSSMF